MILVTLHDALIIIQHTVSFIGILIILSGALIALAQYIYYIFTQELKKHGEKINVIRLTLGRIIILGLEFIIAADLIGTTTAPDYYSVGIVASIVAIRTILSYTLSREIASLSKETH